ncbi:MAG TPA: glycoside hydrolase family 76 protein [Actinocrinis sp.]
MSLRSLIPPRPLPVAAMLLAAGAILLPAAPAAAAPAPKAATAPQTASITALMQYFNTGTGRWDSSLGWQDAQALTTLIDYMQLSGDSTYSYAIADVYNDNGANRFTDQYIDDTGWWGMAWLRAYQYTGNTAYLQTAEYDDNYMSGYWDSGCGGLWWSTAETNDNAIENELYLELSASLHNAMSGDTTYLSRAEQEWTWFSGSGLINSKDLVNDGLNVSTCQNNGNPTYTYNQGVVLAGLAQLSLATGNSALITTADGIATAATTTLTSNGILVDPCEPNGCANDGYSFKGIFVRDLAEFARATGNSAYNGFLDDQEASILGRDTNSSGQSGVYWSGPISALTMPNQQSAADAFNATIGLTAGKSSAAVDTGINASGKATLSDFSLGANGHVYQSYLNAGGSWHEWDMTAGGAAPSAAGVGPAIVDSGITAAGASTLSLFTLGDNDHVYQTHLTPGGGWIETDLTASGAAPTASSVGPAIIDSGINTAGVTTLSLFTVGTNDHVYQSHISAGGSWQLWDMTVGGVAPTATSVGAATADTGVNASGATLSVFSVGANRDVYQSYLNAGGSWHEWDMTASGAAPSASSVGGAAVDTGVNVAGKSSLSVFTLGTNGHVYQALLTAGGGWSTVDLTAAGVAPTATDVAGVIIDTGVDAPGTTLSVFAVGTNGHVYQAHRAGGGSWAGWDMTGGNVAPTATSIGSTTLDTGVNQPGQTLSVFTVAAGADVYQSHLTEGGSWGDWDMTAGGIAPAV